MEQKLISLSTAKLVKEKGFTAYSEQWYEDNEGDELFSICFPGDEGLDHYMAFTEDDNYNITSYQDGFYFAHPQSFVQAWLRDVHNILIFIVPFKDHASDVNDDVVWNYAIYNKSIVKQYKSYEEALEEGIIEGLKLITTP